MVATADKEVVARPLDDACGHAIRHVERVLDKRPVWTPQVWINNVHGTECQISGVRIRICNQKATGVGIECGPADTSDGNRSEASSRRGGLTGTELSTGVEHRPMMAGYIGTKNVHARSVTAYAGGHGFGGVRTDEAGWSIEAAIVDDNGGIVLDRTVVIDLP